MTLLLDDHPYSLWTMRMIYHRTDDRRMVVVVVASSQQHQHHYWWRVRFENEGRNGIDDTVDNYDDRNGTIVDVAVGTMRCDSSYCYVSRRRRWSSLNSVEPQI